MVIGKSRTKVYVETHRCPAEVQGTQRNEPRKRWHLVPLVLWSFTQTATPLAGRLFIDHLSNGRGLHRDLGQGRCNKMAKVGRLAKPLVNFTAMSHSCRRRYTVSDSLDSVECLVAR